MRLPHCLSIWHFWVWRKSLENTRYCISSSDKPTASLKSTSNGSNCSTAMSAASYRPSRGLLHHPHWDPSWISPFTTALHPLLVPRNRRPLPHQEFKYLRWSSRNMSSTIKSSQLNVHSPKVKDLQNLHRAECWPAAGKLALHSMEIHRAAPFADKMHE